MRVHVYIIHICILLPEDDDARRSRARDSFLALTHR
jgi:hypothetical protein